VCLASALDTAPVVQLRQLLGSAAWRASLEALKGYSPIDQAGQVQSLRSMLPWWQFRSSRPGAGA